MQMLFTALFLVLSGSGILFASGTYRFTPPRPPLEGVAGLDEELYAQGRNLLTSKVEPSGRALPGLVEIQASRLTSLQSMLPRSIQERVDLPGLAPLLSPTEMAALEYYTILRYRIEFDSEGGAR